MSNKTENLIPVKDYAEKHKISVQAVYQKFKTGKLKKKKIGNFIFVVINPPEKTTPK